MIKRVKLLMNEFSMSENEFAKALSMSQSTLNGYTKESRKPSLALAESVLNAFEDVSAEWLLRGKGSMYKTTELPTVDVTSEESINHSAEIARLVRENNELIDENERLKMENIRLQAKIEVLRDLLQSSMTGEPAQKVG